MGDKEKKPRGYWNNYDNCYNEAKKCKTKGEFKTKYPCAYRNSRQNGWLDKFDWFEEVRKPRGYWTKEHCFEEAKKYKTSGEFQKNNPVAYTTSIRNGWFSEYDWLTKQKPNGYWNNYDNCYNEAIKYKTRTEFEKHCGSAYQSAKRNGWLDDYFWFERNKNPYTNGMDNVYAYFFNELNAVYVGRTIYVKKRNNEHHKTGSVYKFAKKNNIEIPEMTILESGLSVIDGLDIEDYYRNKYKKEGWNVLNKAKTGIQSGSLGAIGAGKWNCKSCFKLAQQCKCKSEMKEKNQRAYILALTNGWFEDYTWFLTTEELKHQKRPSRVKWTFESCLEESKKYHSKKEFRKKNGSAYTISGRNGWLDEFFPKVAA